ncbi:endonuclease/exonuclease/phosphatase family protein [Pseudovirgaria hyperparasitica]|uniref:Endonuclease/exonuclease/phosphatase family protein n=1 Tax=Pseudovirgaria hyperparasitica TaxID=470096 RepID=A0A6A6WI69_9PEZI|nr:endonuclease/exonuclease/phosphatase family protein [Pseudovirgaria hyperparasitica]KAF2760841.1 endonuclease/exonuclease/phosphatase family protein [Pseudovirgaria hyperparasitica]
MKLSAVTDGIAVLSLSNLGLALTIAEINGNRFLSPYAGQAVSNVTGLVTAKSPAGIYIRSTTPDNDVATSESLHVFSSTIGRNLSVGDIVNLGGVITEYRPVANPTYMLLTELTSPRNVTKLSSGTTVAPLVIGKDTGSPPTQQYSGLDNGDIFGVPNNSSQISIANPLLRPGDFGLDFWESLSGELVTVKGVKAISKPNNFGDTWVTGDWKVSGRNSRGGLTMTNKDGNPEAIIIGTPLDGTNNSAGTKLGDSLQDITGVITYAFGFYRILPLTGIVVTSSAAPTLPSSTTLTSGKTCKDLTFGSYNVENLTPTKSILPAIASHIANVMKSPSLVFLQEIQDNNGATNDAIVDANLTLASLASAINSISGVSYSYVDIDPVDDQDGGEPGGNIRTAYLYDPAVLRLRKVNPGSSTDANEVLAGPELKYNPGRIDPTNPAWQASRKPLAAAWETLDGRNKRLIFYSIEGDSRPPINGVLDVRTQQANITATFIRQILSKDPTSSIVTAGDFNEFVFANPLKVFQQQSSMQDLDEIAGLVPEERYTYLFDMNCQQLDHIFVSPALAAKKYLGRVKYEHIHINTWEKRDAQISDHDPSVAKLDVCRLF